MLLCLHPRPPTHLRVLAQHPVFITAAAVSHCLPPHSLPQVRNFSDLSSLAGLSVGTMLLALLGNSACIPRALFTRDPAWTFGSTWGAIMMGWAQCLSLTLGVNPDTG